MTVTSLPWPSRLWLSFICALQVLFDGRFAARVAALRGGSPEQLAAPERVTASAQPPTPPSAPAMTPAPPGGEALQLLSILQREGRLIDFLEQDIAAFGDDDVGAAARVVHEGCRRALRTHARVASIRSEAEGSALTLERVSSEVKLIGNVAGAAPYRGVLRHRGWRIDELKLPTRVGEHDLGLIAPAELELR
jgi:Domain of unknown function (DUF2760)